MSQEPLCAFCPERMDTEVIVTDPSETMNLPLGEDPPERSLPVCGQCLRVIRGSPTLDDEPWPDWEEIDYERRERFA